MTTMMQTIDAETATAALSELEYYGLADAPAAPDTWVHILNLVDHQRAVFACECITCRTARTTLRQQAGSAGTTAAGLIAAE